MEYSRMVEYDATDYTTDDNIPNERMIYLCVPSRTSFLSKYDATTDEQDYRFRAFKKKLTELDSLNALERFHNGTAVFGITMISDHSPAEFILR